MKKRKDRILSSNVFPKKREQRSKNKSSSKNTADRITVGSEETLENLLILWLQNGMVRCKGATSFKYQYMIERHILPELGKLRVSEISSHKINTFLADKLATGRLDGKGGLAPSYVKTLALILRSAFAFGKEEKICGDLPIAVAKPEEPKKELCVLSRKEQSRLESWLKTELDTTKLGILLSLHTGMRIGELCALSWDDIDLNSDVIHVRHTVSRIPKSGSGASLGTELMIGPPKTKASLRDIPVSSALRPYLVYSKERKNSDYVISDKPGFESPRTFDYRYRRVLQECGMRTINFHALRHTFATRCIEVGVDVKTLSELLGHSKLLVKQRQFSYSDHPFRRRCSLYL